MERLLPSQPCMQATTLRHASRAVLALAILLAYSPKARADDAGDASEDTSPDAPPDSPLKAAAIDAAIDAPNSAESSVPAVGTPECPVEDIGIPCDHGGTCAPAMCGDWGTGTMHPCAACSSLTEPSCAVVGAACGDGGVCQAIGGGGGSGVSLDGGSEFISATDMGCVPPVVQSSPAWYGGYGGDDSTGRYPVGCCAVAPLGTSPGRALALAAALAVVVTGRRRRSARPRA